MFEGILNGINSVLGNYGWTIVVFTLLVRLILMPFDYKSRVSMRKTTQIQPELMRLQKKYANDKEKLNKKTMELYQKAHISPLSSCLPMLITFPLLIIMFNAMRSVAYQQLAQQTFDILLGHEPHLESWLWIKNLWMPDSPFAASWPDLGSIQIIGADVWQKIYAALSEADVAALTANYGLTLESFDAGVIRETVEAMYAAMAALPEYTAHIAPVPGGTFNLWIATVTLMKNYNGLLILPILSAVSQYLMTALTPTQTTDNAQAQSTNNFMKWFFPIFTLVLCFSYTASFALYWVASNLISMVQTFIINKYLDKKDAQTAPVGEGSVK